MGNAHYNSLQANLSHTSGPLSILASYTLGKSVDWGSNIGEQVDPYHYARLRAISAYDIRHNSSPATDTSCPWIDSWARIT